MKKSLLKNTFREIKNTKARFFSIMAIIALGVGFYCGIKATVPSMNNMADNYYRRTNLMDYRLVSTVGLDDDDINAFKKIPHITNVEASYYADVISNYNNSAHEIRLIATTDNLNKLTVTEGRLPQKKGEIAVEHGSFSGILPEIGDTITLEEKSGDSNTKDMLKTVDYTVVGYVRSPLYISYERGNTTIGDGSLDSYMYVAPSNFSYDRYTEVYIRTDYSDGETVNDEYTKEINKLKKEIKKAGKQRLKIFKTENIDSAQEELDQKKQEYRDSKADAENKLRDTKKKLDNSANTYNQQIASAQAEINSGQTEINQGYSDYYSQKERYESEISKAEKKIKSSQKEYDNGLKKYNSGLKEYNSGLKKYREAYDTFYNTTKPQLESQLEKSKAGLEQIEIALKTIDEQIKSADNEELIAALNSQREELLSKKQQADSAVAQIEKGIKLGESELSSTKAELDKAKKELNNSKKKLDSGKSELQKGKVQLEKAKSEGKLKLDEAYAKLKSGENQLAESKAQIEEMKKSGVQQLKDGRNEYKKSKNKTEKKLSEAKEKLDKAQDELDDINRLKLYVFTREDNPGYSTFSENTNRIDAVASVFPVFFLLVAILVCLTTMTRLVDEKRTEIGTLKALGYSNVPIVGKFLVYAASAGFIGAVIGILLGVNTLPYIIYNAYKMMYSMDEITVVTNPYTIVISTILALICTAAVTGVTCYKSLNNRPSKLMRPKGPKAGKRILLEQITVLWKHFNFTSKVTARNLFRYKSRMFMTVLGVAGCTALIISAFGLNDALSAISGVQFNEIFHHNTFVVPENNVGDKQLEDIRSDIDSYKNVLTNCLTVFDDSVVTAEGSDKFEATAFIPEKTDVFYDIITLRTRVGHNPITLSNDGAVITEKLASKLGVNIGDSINLETNDRKKSLKVTAICEQYVGNYVYMSSSFYEKTFGTPEYNTFLVNLSGDESTRNEFGNHMLKRDDIIGVTFIQSSIDEFNDILSSMNMVVIIMIICAGALAFVVLYNLTNINIAERNREIATIKVLGFNNRETSAYIYRENMALVILGIILGIVLGTFLSMWIIVTIEIDSVMFGRDISLLSYIYSALLTVAFAVIVNIFMYFKIKRIDMVESLKSVE